MKKASRIIWGILILALGVVLFGNAAKLWDVSIFFDGWWAVLIMALALFSVCTDKPNIVNVYFLIFGGVMLLKEQGVLIPKETSSWAHSPCPFDCNCRNKHYCPHSVRL